MTSTHSAHGHADDPYARSLAPLRIFLASPSDMAAERQRLRNVIDELNVHNGSAEQHGFTLKLLAWEDAYSSMGRPEDVILDQMPVEQWDIFVGMLWTRFGSPTGKRDPVTGMPYDSGTEEEFRLAYRAQEESKRPHILFYRRTGSPPSLDDIDPLQLVQVQAFFKEFSPTGDNSGLFNTYETPDEFERSVRMALLKLLAEFSRKRRAAPSAPAKTAPAADEDHTAHYLQWLCRAHGRLELRGIRVRGQLPTVPLDKVYAALRGIETSPGERAQSALLHQEEWRLYEQSLGPSAHPSAKRRAPRRRPPPSPWMPSLLERDRPSVFTGGRKAELLNLADAFRRYRWLVILGDPGSGKTTLARWLTLHLAQAVLDGEPRVRVAAAQVNPTAADDAPAIDLGPARLPVLMRVSDFAEERKKRPDLSLGDYIGHHPWLGEYPTFGKGHARQGDRIPGDWLNTLIKIRLRQGQAVILLDGLDEITRGTERDAIVRAVEAFLRDWVATDDDTPFDDPAIPWHAVIDSLPPSRVGGNQLIVTSRIAGYHAAPLTGRTTDFTIEAMETAAIDRFCDSWTQAVAELLAGGDESAGEVAERAGRAAVALKAAIHDPERPGVAEMASNPLLLTILALVHHNTQARLPEQRVRLYQIAVENLVEVWRVSKLSEDEVVNVLAPLAAHIHSTYATGLIPEPDLRERLTIHLAAYRGHDPDDLPPGFTDDVDSFLETVREQVGLLADRGGYYYGFLHLTFQEYLAARYLVRDPALALERILELANDPRWREPVLLALGYAMIGMGVEARDRLLQGVLTAQDPLGDLLPRRPLLMAAALPEFVQKPAPIVSRVTERLLVAYADRDGVGRYEQLRRQIERSMARLRRDDTAEAVDRALLAALRRRPAAGPDLRPAAAALIAANGWATSALADALYDALPADSRDWNWPAARALAAIAAQAPDLLPPERLSFRRALLRAPSLRERLAADLRWQRLVWFLAGGLSGSGFDPVRIFLEPAHSGTLRTALRAGRPAAGLAAELQAEFTDANLPPARRAEAFMGLLALGAAPALDPGEDELLDVVQDRLGRLLAVWPDMPSLVDAGAIVAAIIPAAAQLPELLPEALTSTAEIIDAGTRARALTALAPHLPPELLGDALSAAAWIEDDIFGFGSRSRARAVAALAPHLPPELLGDALSAAAGIEDAFYHANAVAALAPHLPPEQKSRALADALSAAAGIEHDFFGSRTRADAVTALAPHLPPELLADALSAAAGISSASSRADAVAALAPHLPPELLADALSAAAGIEHAFYRAGALTALAPHLPPEQKSRALADALSAAAGIEHALYRAGALTALAPHLPPELLRKVWASSYDALLRAAPVDVARRLLEQMAPSMPWDDLRRLETRQEAAATLLAQGRATGLQATMPALSALQAALKDDPDDAVLALLSVINAPEEEVSRWSMTPSAQIDESWAIVNAWQAHPAAAVRAFASLLRAEGGRPTPSDLPHLVALLAGDDDRARYRAYRAITWGWSSRKLSVTSIGVEFVEELVRLEQQHEADPRVATVLGWGLNGLTYDDPAALAGWLDAWSANEGRRPLVSAILGRIHDATAEAWPVLAQKLDEPPSDLTPRLLESVYWLITYEKVPEGDLPALHHRLADLMRSSDLDLAAEAIRCLGRRPAPDAYATLRAAGEQTPALAGAAYHALADLAARDEKQPRQDVLDWLIDRAGHADRPDHAQAVAAIARLRARAEQTPVDRFPAAGLLDQLAAFDQTLEGLLAALLAAGTDRELWGDSHERLVAAGRLLLSGRPELVPPLLSRLAEALAGDDWPERRIALAFAAAAAEELPGAFARAATPERWEPLFARAVRDAESFSARRFALTVLGRLQRVTPQSVEALRWALRDVEAVQTDALHTAGYFRDVEGDLVPELAAGLADPSAAAAYGVGLMMGAVAHAATTNQAQREAIVTALAEAIRSPHSQRDVYTTEGHVIRYQGRLDQLLHQILVELTEGSSS